MRLPRAIPLRNKSKLKTLDIVVISSYVNHTTVFDVLFHILVSVINSKCRTLAGNCWCVRTTQPAMLLLPKH